MPYITQKEQKRLKPQLDVIMLGTKGELTYCINVLQMRYLEQRFSNERSQKINYQDASDVMAAASDANQEFYDQVMRKYEDHKKRENGDVFQEFVRKANI